MELKPCPFCGGSEQEVERDIQDGFEADYYVRCGYCDARSGRCGNKSSAQSEWNKRQAVTLASADSKSDG